MQCRKGWQTASVLGMIILGVASMPPLPTSMAQAQIQRSNPTNGCTAQPGETFEQLTRDLVYRSQKYIRDRQFDLAVRALDRALQTVATVEDPFSKTDLVASVAGQSGEQPSTMEQLVQQATTPQQQAKLLNLLSKLAKATQTLEGEYGVINTKRAILVQLADHYTALEQPNQARASLEQARQLLNSLQGDGFGLIASPVAQGYTALGDTQTAIALLDQAVRRTQAMKTDNLDYLADIFSTIAIAYASAGGEAKAVQTTQQIKVATVKARTLAQIAKQAAQIGSPQATRILAQAQAQTKALPAASRSDALSQIALTYGYLKEWDLALESIAPIQSAEIKIQTLADLASISDRLDHPANGAKPLGDLVAIARKMSFYDSDTWVRKIFTQYLANGQYGLALQLTQPLDATLQQDLLLKLIEAASAASEFEIARQAVALLDPGWQNQTRSLGWRAVATGYAKAGQYEQAIQLLSQIEDTPDYPSRILTQLTIAQAYGKSGQPEAATQQLNQALQALQALDNTSAKLEALSRVAAQFAQLGQSQQAVEVQTQAVKLTKAANSNTPSTTYVVEQFISQYLNAEQYPLALQLVQTLENETEHDRQLQRVLQQMLEVGDLAAARQAVKEIRNPQQRVALWVKASDYYSGMGQQEQAAEMLAQAFAIANALPGVDENRFTEAARLDPSIPIDDELDRGSLITSIAIRYAELKRFDLAKQTAQALRSSADRQRLIQKVACYE